MAYYTVSMARRQVEEKCLARLLAIPCVLMAEVLDKPYLYG